MHSAERTIAPAKMRACVQALRERARVSGVCAVAQKGTHRLAKS
jgi:hypothetical protein